MSLLYRMSVAAVAMGCCASAAIGQSRLHVVELYTSEGCSSCPPAEAQVGELAQRPDVLALAFHVDYWDDLGWRDRFALGQATERQRAYARALRLSSVYTPQWVIEGRDSRADGASARSLVGGRANVPVAIRVEEGHVIIELGAQGGLTSADVLLVPYLRNAVSAIGRGENAGRTLQEFNIVRAIRALGRWDGRAHTFQADLSALPADATDVAVLVQAPGQGAFLGAATHPLR
jgi:hypothetical protein